MKMMMNRRLLAVTVSLFALPLAGCTPGGGTEAAAPPKVLTPQETLAASTAGVDAGNYKFTMTAPGAAKASGSVHSASKSGEIAMLAKDKNADSKIEIRVVGDQRFTKMTLTGGEMEKQYQEAKKAAEGVDNPEIKKMMDGLDKMMESFSGKTWMRLDTAKVKDPGMQFGVTDNDPLGIKPLLAAVVTAEGAAPAIKGTIDVTKITSDEKVFGADGIKGIDKTAGAKVPYVATLGAGGKLAKLDLDMPKVADNPAGTWTITFTDYGAAQPIVVPPANEIEEASDEVYQNLNG